MNYDVGLNICFGAVALDLFSPYATQLTKYTPKTQFVGLHTLISKKCHQTKLKYKFTKLKVRMNRSIKSSFNKKGSIVAYKKYCSLGKTSSSLTTLCRNLTQIRNCWFGVTNKGFFKSKSRWKF